MPRARSASESRAGETRDHRGDRAPLNGWTDRLVNLARIVTPAGVIAIALFVSQIQHSIDRNCIATTETARGVVGIVAVDNELAKNENEQLRKQLIGALRRVASEDCDS